MMPDTNTASLRAHEASQVRSAIAAGTDGERERFIDDWFNQESIRMGREFVFEAITELPLEKLAELGAAFRTGSSLELGDAVRQVILSHYMRRAESACDAHDFTPEPPCRCGEVCTC